MNDVSPAKPARRPLRAALWLLLLLAVLAALGYAGWRVEQLRRQAQETLESQDALLRRLGRQQSLEQSQLNELSGRVADLAQSTRSSGEDLAALKARADDAQAALDHLQEAVQGGRRRVQLLGVEQLLLVASDRAQLAHDPRGALDALTLAQDRLGAIADPRLFEIRKALADERAALAAVTAPDVGGTALALGSLIARVPKLTLRNEMPEQYHGAAALPAVPAPEGWRARFMQSVHGALDALFTVRRTDVPIDRLLSAEQQGLIGQVLVLKLENARSAWLAGQTAAWRAALGESTVWLSRYYREQDPGVLAAQSELERLQALDPQPALPDLGRSLGLLRAYLEAVPADAAARERSRE